MSASPIGLLTGRFHQMAYVTNDIDRAMADFAEKGGVHRFFQGRDSEFEVGPAPGVMARAHVALAFAGGVQIELIQPLGGHDAVYRQALSGSDYQLHYHHEAHVLDSMDRFRETKARIQELGYEIVIDSSQAMCSYFYADTRSLIGHFTEYFFFSEDALRYFAEVVPVN